jgi:hypothetical protein
VVIALFSSPNEASVCLSNLAEADFGPDVISIVAKTINEAKTVGNASGPLNALTADELGSRLAATGLPPAVVATYVDGVRKGAVFLAVTAHAADDAAKETLEDHNANAVRIVDSD